MSRKFLRTGWNKKVRLGKKNKKLQKWRRARGRHNKTREKRKGRARKVEVGFRTDKRIRGKISGKIPVIIKNLRDAEKIGKNELAIIARMGKKKRLEVEKKLKEKNIQILNLLREK